MKNIIKLKAIRRIAGIIVLTVVIGFSFDACNGGGGIIPVGLSAPTGLTATVVSSSAICLSWNAASVASEHNVL
jgi:hypothetical protein